LYEGWGEAASGEQLVGSLLGVGKRAYKPKPPSRAVLASWVELLSYQAGGGHYYEDVRCILTPLGFRGNIVKVLGNQGMLTASESAAFEIFVRAITAARGSAE